MSTIFSVFYIYLDSISFLLLSALGLIIILGMMGITNMAHGEFMMLGAYTAALATAAGLPFPLSVLLAMLVVGGFGILMERLVIRRFYGNLLQSLVATWGLSLIISQTILIIFGPYIPTLPIPLGGFTLWGKMYAVYRLALPILGFLSLLVLALLLFKTRFGLKARATMQSPEMAEAMGVNTTTMYMIVFGIGSALSGLAGALYAPTTVLSPTYGSSFLAPAFVTVVVSGGANVIVGAVVASVVLGIIEGSFNFTFDPIIGRLSLLIATVFVIRFFPSGLSGWLAARGGRK